MDVENLVHSVPFLVEMEPPVLVEVAVAPESRRCASSKTAEITLAVLSTTLAVSHLLAAFVSSMSPLLAPCVHFSKTSGHM